MIKSFRDNRTEEVFLTIQLDSKKINRLCNELGLPTQLVRPIKRKLIMLNAATDLKDLKSPPGNRLEKLSGDRDDQWSIRINDKYRICFQWRDGDAWEVEITNYH